MKKLPKRLPLLENLTHTEYSAEINHALDVLTSFNNGINGWLFLSLISGIKDKPDADVNDYEVIAKPLDNLMGEELTYEQRIEIVDAIKTLLKNGEFYHQKDLESDNPYDDLEDLKKQYPDFPYDYKTEKDHGFFGFVFKYPFPFVWDY